MTGGDGIHDRGRSGDHVAGREDPRQRRHQSVRLGEQAASLSGRAAGQEGEVGFLTHRRQHVIGLDQELRPRHRDGTPAAVGVGRSQRHLEALEAPQPPFLDDCPHRGGQEAEPHPFHFGGIHLVVRGAHLLAGAPVEDLHR